MVSARKVLSRTSHPSILRFFVANWAAGMALGLVFASALLWFDIGGLFSLIRRSDMAIPALALLFGGFALTCGGIVCASAVMRLGQDERPATPGRPFAGELVPVPVRANQTRTPR